MKLVKSKFKIRCESGGCKNYSDYVLYMDRCGIHSSVYICGDCVRSLKEVLERLREDGSCPAEENFPLECVRVDSVLSETSGDNRDAATSEKRINKRKKADEKRSEKNSAGEEVGE